MANVAVTNGWLTVDGVKVAKVQRGALEFRDPCRRRSAERGSAVVVAPTAEIAQAVTRATPAAPAGPATPTASAEN